MTKFTALMSGSVMLSLGAVFVTPGDKAVDATTPSAQSLMANAHIPLGYAGLYGSAVEAMDENALIQDFCVRCHNPRRLRGNLSLQDFDVTHAASDPETTEKVIHKLRAGMMPPAGTRRPAEEALANLAEVLENRVDSAFRADPNPGRRTFQRLNRAEYRRSVRELLTLEVDVDGFLPAETISENFDNIADVQNLSVTVMEGYLRAAAHISRMAVGDPDASATTTTYKVPRTASQAGHVEGAPLGTRGGMAVTHTFPADGEYTFGLEFYVDPVGNMFGNTSRDEVVEISIDGERVATVEVDRWMSESDPDGVRVNTGPIHVRAGPHNVAAAFLQKSDGPTDDLVRLVDHTLADTQIGNGGYGVTTVPHLRDLSIAGPTKVTGVSDTPSRRRVFTCRPTLPAEERECATQILSRLSTNAYRRPVDDDDLGDLLAFYDQGRTEGGFESGIRMALQAVLASPHFIFRFEETPTTAGPGEVYRVDDLDLASRLSYFLWATPPDQELLATAEAQRLSDPDELERQTLRMLQDSRAEALATRFASQWLRLQDLEKIHPDAQLFPYFDQTLAASMERETELFFHNLIVEDRSLLELLTADYTFVNERVARHYGIPGVTGHEFRRVVLRDDNRRGLLGHGSVLTLTSHADRTSPVLRGKWVMEVLLGSPPPPPPPDVPDLEATEGVADGRELTTRERMEQHRSNPACNSCHQVIDPIGLALDNFDVTGAWRIKENGRPVDATGELYDGAPLGGPADLRSALVARPSVFVRTFTKNLMAYALGRRIEATDMPTVRQIEREAGLRDNRMSAFILGVVQSPAFQMSRVEIAADEAMPEER